MEGLAIAAIILLLAAVLVLAALLCRQSDRTFSLRNALEESESRRREISNFLTRFSAGIKGEEGFFGAMNAAAIHIGEQTDSESVAIYILDGSELRGVSVYGTYPLVHTANKLVFTRRRHLLETLRRETIAPGEGFLGGIVISRLAELVPCGAEDERFRSYPEFSNLGGIMAVPMLRDGALVGVICAVGNRQRPGHPFTANQFERLKLLAPQVLMVHNLVMAYGEISRRDRIDQELELARVLQQSLLPKSNPNWGEFSIRAYSRSAKEVNGDFYDFIQIDDDRMLVMIADACGKGIPACMVMAMTRSFIRANIGHFTSLEAFLLELNNNLYQDTGDERYITLACCILNKRDVTFEYARAGHTELMLYTNEHIRSFYPEGSGVGLLPSEFTQYDTFCMEFHPGMSAFLFTDGLNEATRERDHKEEFGLERLRNLFLESCTKKETPEEFFQETISTIDTFAGTIAGEDQEDDQTMVMIRHV